ncbi:DUF1127 domain-containing protein [Celeribacter sp.]|uniref:DUF1127 domain-containing protein n=1 Tax=Celeribacter sp. TaxID=1890673 RepID=UPI003A90177D
MLAMTFSRSRGARLAPSFSAIVERILCARSLARQRAALTRLDDAMLADIGLTREQAMAEATRPVWDAPRHWRA